MSTTPREVTFFDARTGKTLAVAKLHGQTTMAELAAAVNFPGRLGMRTVEEPAAVAAGAPEKPGGNGGK